MNKRQYKKYVKKLHEQGILTREEEKMRDEILRMIFEHTQIGETLKRLNQFSFYQWRTYFKTHKF